MRRSTLSDLDDEDLQGALGGAEGLDGILSIENTRVFETDGLGDGNAASRRRST